MGKILASLPLSGLWERGLPIAVKGLLLRYHRFPRVLDMFRSISLAVLCSICIFILSHSASAQQGYGQQWATSNSQNWQRFYYYPYVYYPHNYYPPEYYQSGQDIYHRYPAEMQVPAYDKTWINFYPSQRRYHNGNHFRLDIF